MLAGLCVVSGAFGAHALEARLAASGHAETWQTAVRYQMWHGLALLLLSLRGSGALRLPAGLFIVGTVLFSGSLYWISLGGPGWLGPITPIGGLALIAGWVAWGLLEGRTHRQASG